MLRILFALALLLLALMPGSLPSGGKTPLRIATFQVDATPPLGTALCDGLVQPVREIVDPLSARGLILLTEQKPVVLCVLDWVGIGNEGHDAFRDALAEAVGTTGDRVSVHTIHQHDAPGCDFAAEKLLAGVGLSGAEFDPGFARKVGGGRVAAAARKALDRAEPVTHLGLGVGVVEKVASNRRILGPNGKVALVRYSACKDARGAVAAPEGTIDPRVRLISFWQGDRPLASLTYYATHPQSYYGGGGVSADFPGLARKLREAALPQVAHLYFNGAGGNVTAGKYNDGSPGLRPVLAQRLADGMKAAWESQKKYPLTTAEVGWTTRQVALPPRSSLAEEQLLANLHDKKLTPKERVRYARDLAFVQLTRSGRKITLGCLRLGPARVLHMPGELFVEYQLAAQKMRSDEFVALAAYGDYGPGYIGTAIAYTQGGYETGIVSRVNPEVEQVLLDGMRQLLGVGGTQ